MEIDYDTPENPYLKIIDKHEEEEIEFLKTSIKQSALLYNTLQERYYEFVGQRYEWFV